MPRLVPTSYSERKAKMDTARKELRLPKPGELVNTSPALCSLCTFSAVIGGNEYFICDYYLATGNMRGCICGTCDKFQRRVGSKKTKLLS